jgi:periplasmic protein TonB
LRADAITRLSRQFDASLAQNRLVEPADDSAKFYLIQLQQTELEHPATRFAQKALTARLLEEARGFVSRQDLTAARRWLAEARDTGASAESIAAVEQEILTSQDDSAKPKVAATPAIPLKKLRNVNPEYPAEARKRGVSGWVELSVTVQPDGSVGQVTVLNAEPHDVFDKAAAAAASQWRYAPFDRDDRAVEQRTTVRVLFQLK